MPMDETTKDDMIREIIVENAQLRKDAETWQRRFHESNKQENELMRSLQAKNHRLDRELTEARAMVISGFYEEKKPIYTQGVPTHELQSVVTAAEVTQMADKIFELRARLENVNTVIQDFLNGVIGGIDG